MNCIFCKIIAGEIPAYKVYESENVLAFLDITPKSLGHTLVIPKQHSNDLLSLDSAEFDYMGEIQKVASILKGKFNYDGINLVNNCGKIAGQEVFHTHFHLIPKYSEEQNVAKDDFEKISKML